MFAIALAGLERLLDRFRGGPHERARLNALDSVLALACAIAGAAVSVWAFGVIGDVVYTASSLDIWFQADNPRVAANLLDPASNQYRANVHPIFPILFTPWLSTLAQLGGSPLIWAKGAVAAAGALSAAALYLALRFTGLPRWPALLFAALFVSSATYLHWYSVIEVAAFSGLSICLAVAALAYGPGRQAAWLLMSVFTLGLTLTNWSAGLAATLARWPLRRAVVISLVALALTGGLAVGQRLLYPTAGLFFDPHGLVKEREYAGPRVQQWSPLANLRALTVYASVAPAPVVERHDDKSIVSNQHQGPGTAGWLGIAAMLSWVACLAAGALGAITTSSVRPIAFGLGLMLAAQLALGLVYGDVSFLYAANIMPMLVLLAGLSWFTRLRYAAATLAAVTVLAGGASNAIQYSSAARLAAGVLAAGGNPIWSLFPAGRVILPGPDSSNFRPTR